MITSGIYSFHKIIESIREETGIQNLSNEIFSIRKMIYDAVFDINPWGTMLVKKTMLFYKGNGNFDGRNIKKPSDFVMVDRDQQGLHETISHFMICDQKVRDKVEFTYWGLQCDGEGNPVVSNNHAPAVVAYIVWKMYSPKVFMGEGSAQMRREYKMEYETLALAARGHDAFPTETALRNMRRYSMMSMLDMDYSLAVDRCIKTSCIPVTDDNIKPMTNKAWYWQFNSVSQNIESADEVTDSFLENNATQLEFTSLLNGQNFNQPYVGRLGFVIEGVEFGTVSMIDVLGADTRSAFNHFYDFDKKRLVIVSKNAISQSSIFLKFTHNGE